MIGGELVHGELELKDGSSADGTRQQMTFRHSCD
jgi:hypothetical protein